MTTNASLLAQAAALRAVHGDYSISFLQRHLKLGYGAALDLDAQLGPAGGKDLPVHTRIFADNASGGLLLCGINHGYTKEDERLDSQGVDRSDPFKSFFSDKRVNDYRLRNNIVKWFELWGFPLQTEHARAGMLERSIVQTNWLQTCTSDARGFSVQRECVANADSFLATCEQLKPRLMLLFSKELLWALSSSALRPRVQAIFGQAVGPVEWVEKPVPNAKCFKIGRLRFERGTVLSLPHASGAQGITDAFIGAQEAVKAEIATWWEAHRAAL